MVRSALTAVAAACAGFALVALFVHVAHTSDKGAYLGTRCQDGWISSSLGPGTCSHHGGIKGDAYADQDGAPPPPWTKLGVPIAVASGVGLWLRTRVPTAPRRTAAVPVPRPPVAHSDSDARPPSRTRLPDTAPVLAPAITVTSIPRLELVGAQFYAEAVSHLPPGVHRLLVVLDAERDNPYDANAVGVFLGGRKVGHLSRSDAIRHRTTVEVAVSRDGVAAMYAEFSIGAARTRITLTP